jgi:hypothetical protein
MISLLIIGVLLSTLGYAWMLFIAFKTGVFWGIGCILMLPLYAFLLIKDWGSTSNPLFLFVTGLTSLYFSGVHIQ